jgi:4-amino-4-deoxy-L-arabinose transferase-like glycosyltransferase
MTAERQSTVVPRTSAGGTNSGVVFSIQIVAWIRAHWALLAVFVAFALAAVVVPTLVPVATTDDWAYARSAQILRDEGRLTIFPVVAATAVFQIVWGALFGLIFEPTLGIFRLSTVVITGLGGLALYGLCRDLDVARGRAALGVATFLFNPLVFVLAFTFMTDAHFMALLVIATWLYAKAIEPEKVDGRLLVAGSGVAALAFLTRQQGALIVPAVVVFLLISRRLHPDWASLLLLIQLIALPTLAIAGYYAWLRYGNEVPTVQTSFFREAIEEGWSGTWWLVQRLTVVVLMYLGVFTLPLVVAVFPRLTRLTAGIPRRGWWLFALWQAILLVGVTALWVGGGRMPYVQQWFGSGALGAPDVLGSRPILLTPMIRSALTIVCLIAALLLALVAARAVGAPASLERSRAGLVLAIGLWQTAGILPPSYHYIGWAAGSLDRYLLPLVPLTIALALWALRGVRVVLPLGWIIVAALALFSIAGTRDYLVFMREVWAMAEEATAAGVPLDRLDAGSGWDGYHLYEYGLEHGIRSRTPKGGPWWVYFYAPATDSAYVVAGKPLTGYDVIRERSYSSWLQREPTKLYLLHRADMP